MRGSHICGLQSIGLGEDKHHIKVEVYTGILAHHIMATWCLLEKMPYWRGDEPREVLVPAFAPLLSVELGLPVPWPVEGHSQAGPVPVLRLQGSARMAACRWRKAPRPLLHATHSSWYQELDPQFFMAVILSKGDALLVGLLDTARPW